MFNNDSIQFEGYDLFCGGGGVTEGILKARHFGKGIASVIACINHSPIAIKSHEANHPDCKHFTEDIRVFNVKNLPAFSKDKKSFIWISAECTNHSRAKGGRTKNADSRTLPEHCKRYIRYSKPDYVMVENVVEFRDWSPLVPKTGITHDEHKAPFSYLVIEKDENKNKYLAAHLIPDPKRKGETFNKWISDIKKMGYEYDDRNIEAANFGAYGRRNRYFGIFAKPGNVIAFPEATHSKNGDNGLKKWNPVKDVLELDIHGQSIFGRKKELCENTLKRIYEGLKKFATREHFVVSYNSCSRDKNGDLKVGGLYGDNEAAPTVTTQNRLSKVFISKYYSGKPAQKNIDVDGPAGAVTSGDHHSLINSQYLVNTDFTNTASSINEPAKTILAGRRHKYLTTPQFIFDKQFSSVANNLEVPSRTIIATQNKKPMYFITPDFLIGYHGQGENIHSADNVSPAITTKDRLAFIKPLNFIDVNFGNSRVGHSIDVPCQGLVANPKGSLVEVNFLSDILCETELGIGIVIYSDDSPTMIKIKEFMCENGIVDIKMRMLLVIELKRILGLGDDYILLGNQTDQKKMIGNAVHPLIPKAWFETLYQNLIYSKAA